MSVNNKIMDKLGEQGYTGSINERIQANLLDLYGEANINVGLSKAGGFKRYVSDLIGIEYVAKLNGVDQSWDFSESLLIGATQDFEVRCKVMPYVSTTQVIFGSGSSPERLYVGTENGNWLVGNGTDRVVTGTVAQVMEESQISLKVVSGNMVLEINGNPVYNQPVKYSTDKTIQGLSKLVGFFFEGPIYDFELYLDSVLVNRIPLTNKAQGATQLATVGSVNATMIGYDPSVWIIK